MRGELVAIDLETTGLDSTKDAIIEVGAVRIANGEIIDEFSALVNPDRPIPEHITHITGIQHNDVVGAPHINVILPKIAAFAKSSPIIAHNISLDMGFLQGRHQILKSNISIDTYDLAAMLMPRAPRYNLNSLAHQVGINLEHAHRALDDARATALLYWELWQKAVVLPHTLLQEISRAARDLDWGTSAVFTAALRESTTSKNEQNSKLFAFAPLKATPPTAPQQQQKQAVSEKVASYFGENGILHEQMAEFEHRPQQEIMATEIAHAFQNSTHLMVEAGTGTGKSLAYLVPAILWSTLNNERVVISTNTINLQDQLINHDIPALRDLLGNDFTASVMKGRNNYLCPRRLAAARRRRATSIVELRTLAKILVWLLENDSGDKNEINLRGPAEESIWRRLSAKDADCTAQHCETMMNGTCPFHKARKEAEASHILVVNHALLVSDANADNRVLPDYRYAIIDEAHHLEDAITHGLSIHIDKAMLTRRLADLGGVKRGLLGEILTSVRNNAPEKEAKKLAQFVEIIGEATTILSVHLERLFASLYSFMQEARGIRPTDFTVSVRINEQYRRKDYFNQVHMAWQPVDEFFAVISEAVYRLTKALHRLQSHPIPNLDDFITHTKTAAQFMEEMRNHLRTFISEPDANTIHWISVGQGSVAPVIHTAPLHVGSIIEERVWERNESVILTSATLRTQDDFEFMSKRLYAEQVKSLDLGSPFNFQKSALVYIPNDMPEPTERQAYQQAVERSIIELAAALEGRMLVLFTSYSQLRQTSQAVSPRLSLGNIVVYDQSNGSSRQSLLEGFKSTPKAILLGTKSFWEGVDIPGNALSAVVIVRLPFAVPSDPVFAARSDTYSNAFSQYALPEAILRFRQGFGRLIRTQTDRGIVVVLDSRVLSKKYGSRFLDALPDCTQHQGTLDALPATAEEWINSTS